MDPKKLKEEKLKMWNAKLDKLVKEYEAIMKVRGEAMAMGDLRENAAFQMADEDAGTYRVRIDEVKQIIFKLENEQVLSARNGPALSRVTRNEDSPSAQKEKGSSKKS